MKLDPSPAIPRWNQITEIKYCPQKGSKKVAFGGSAVWPCLPSAVSAVISCVQAMKPWQPPWTPNGRNMIPRLSGQGKKLKKGMCFRLRGDRMWPAPCGFRMFQEKSGKRMKEEWSDLTWLYHFRFVELVLCHRVSSVIPMYCLVVAFALGCNVAKMEPSQLIQFALWLEW